MRPIHSAPMTAHDFLFRFFGYGDPTSPLWFVGIEEGGESGLDPASDTHDWIPLGSERWFFDSKMPVPEKGKNQRLWLKYRRISELAGNAGNYFMSNMAPLARPGIKHVLPGVAWPEYQRRVTEERIPALRRLLDHYRPRAVLFHGVTAWRGYRVRETFGVPVREGRIQACPEQRLVFTNFLSRGFPDTDRNDVVALLRDWLGSGERGGQDGRP